MSEPICCAQKKTETDAALTLCFGLRHFDASTASRYESEFRVLFGLLDGFPSGYDRLPDELPLELLPGDVAPPVEEPWLIPK